MSGIAFLDTTNLADVLLKPGTRSKTTQAAIRRFEESQIPCYALKEFRCGALGAYRWVHNLLIEEDSIPRVLERIEGIARRSSKQRTAYEAFRIGLTLVPPIENAALLEKYGPAADPARWQFDELRIQLKRLVLKAWTRRRSIASKVTHELECFEEDDLKEKNGLLGFKRLDCASSQCSLSQHLRASGDTAKIRAKLIADSGGGDRRTSLLKAAIKGEEIARKDCRALGDAVFAILAPIGATILTTNIKDHRPLAEAVGKNANTPEEVLAEP